MGLLLLALLVSYWIFSAFYDKKRMNRLPVPWYLGYLAMIYGLLMNLYYFLLRMYPIDVEISWRHILIPYAIGSLLGSLARLLDCE